MVLNQLPFALCYALLAAFIFETHYTGENKNMWTIDFLQKLIFSLDKQPWITDQPWLWLKINQWRHMAMKVLIKVHWLAYIFPWQQPESTRGVCPFDVERSTL